MNIEEIRDLNMEAVEARVAEIKTEMTAENADLDALNAEFDALSERRASIMAEVEARNTLAQKIADGDVGVVVETVASEERESKKMDINEIRSSDAYAEAYANYIKTGDDSECRSLLTDMVEGTVPTATSIQEAIETAWEKAQLVSRIRKVNVKGILKVPYEVSATDAVVHTEGADAPAEEKLKLGTVVLTPEMLKKWITISDEVLALHGQAFLDYINAEITQRIAELADAEMVAAIKASDLKVTSAATTATWDGLLTALSELSGSATNPVVICNKSVFYTKFISQKDGSERPIFNVISENGKPVYNLLGCTVIFSEELGNAEYIVGDLDGALVNLPEGDGVKFVTDPYSLAEKDLVKVVGRLYAAFGVVRPKYFTVVTVA